MKHLLSTLAVFAPAVALAGGGDAAFEADYITGLVDAIQNILNLLLPLVITLAVLFFFWGLAIFVLNAGDEEARAKGRSIMIWGVVALFFIVTVWGLVALLQQVFGVDAQETNEFTPGVAPLAGGAVGGAGGGGGGGGGGVPPAP